VKFDDVQSLIQPGDVLLFRGRALHSRIIQRWTRSVYSHVGIAHRPVSAGMASLDVLEALEGRGVRTFPLRKYLSRGHAVDWYSITDPRLERDAVVRWLWERRGNRYASYRQILRSFVTTPLLEGLGLPTRIDHEQRFCSFIVAEALLSAGYEPDPHAPLMPELTAPGGIARFNCLQMRGPLVL
jgi:hypothetical protein